MKLATSLLLLQLLLTSVFVNGERLHVPVVMTNPEMTKSQLQKIFSASNLSDIIELEFVNRFPKQKTPLAITLGEKPLAQALLNDSAVGAVITLGIDSQRFRNYSERLKKAKKQLQISAVFKDPPIKRQLQLAKAILPRAKKVGFLYSPENKAEMLEIKLYC